LGNKTRSTRHRPSEKRKWIKDYNGGDILKEIDPIAYRCGFSDYLDSISDEYEIEEENENDNRKKSV
jgi:hypothetical protein